MQSVNIVQSCFYSGNERTDLMKCVHCKRELAFSTRVDRTSGQSVDTYRCVYCGTEMKEYRPNRQTVRS